jgi:hypothetical protein
MVSGQYKKIKSKDYRYYPPELMPNKDELLRTYWNIPQRQVETSVVLGIEM